MFYFVIFIFGSIGAPLGYGQPKVGVENAPDMMRKAGLGSRLANIGWRVENGVLAGISRF